MITEPTAPRTVRWIPWGKGTEAPDAPGLTALTCAALFGLDGYRVGHRSSAVSMPPGATGDLLDERLRGADLDALRHTLGTRRAQRLGDRGWLAQRALHQASWGENCVDALPGPAAITAITDQQIVERAGEIVRFVHTSKDQGSHPDPLRWRGGLYYGVRNQHRLTVGVQLPWPGADATKTVAAYLGRVGAPGLLVQALARCRVPYYAAAAMPIREHGTACLSIGLSTVSDHVVALVRVVRDVLGGIRDTGIPDLELGSLRASTSLYEAIHPSDDPFEHPAQMEVAPAGPYAPAIAVVGRLTEPVVAELREVVHGW